MPITRFFSFLFNFFARLHFGQHGEDVLAHKLFDRRLKKGFYMDIGAYHPFRQSNTAYFWLMGWNGVNVDASPHTIQLFKKIRKTDINVWSAVVDASTASRQKTIHLHFNPTVKYDLSATCTPAETEKRKDWQTARIEVPCESLGYSCYCPNTKNIFIERSACIRRRRRSCLPTDIRYSPTLS